MADNDGLIKLTNEGPETIIIAHYFVGAVHEVYYPKIILTPGEYHEYVLTGPNDILMVSKVVLDQNVSDMINTAIGLGMSNTDVDVSNTSLDDPTKVLTWQDGRLVVSLAPAVMDQAVANIDAAAQQQDSVVSTVVTTTTATVTTNTTNSVANTITTTLGKLF